MWVAAVATAAVLGGVGVAVALKGGGEAELRPAAPDTYYAGVPITESTSEFTIGNLTIREPGRTVTVLSVTPLMSANVEYLGSFTTWPRDYAKQALSVGPGFPPKQMRVRHELQESVPAAETAFVRTGNTDGVPPPLAVAAGFRLRSGDVGAVNGIKVVLKVDGKTVTRIFREAAIVCLPRCEDRPDWERSDFVSVILRQLGLLP